MNYRETLKKAIINIRLKIFSSEINSTRRNNFERQYEDLLEILNKSDLYEK